MNIIWFDLVKGIIVTVLLIIWYNRVVVKKDGVKELNNDKIGWASCALVFVVVFFQPVMLTPNNATQTVRSYDRVDPVVIQEIKRQPVITHKPSDNKDDIERITTD